MITPRRSMLAALAVAPLLGIGASVGAASARPLGDLAALSDADLLELGARNADAAFAALCADALTKEARSSLAWKFYQDAEDAANAATPEFPAALIARGVYRKRDDSTVPVEERWSPDQDKGGMLLWNLAHGEAKRRGVQYSKAVEHDLRAQFGAWQDAERGARAAFMVSELEADYDAATAAASDAFSAVLDQPARNADALLIKLHLLGHRYGVDCDNEAAVDLPAGCFSALIADVARVIAS